MSSSRPRDHHDDDDTICPKKQPITQVFFARIRYEKKISLQEVLQKLRFLTVLDDFTAVGAF